MKKIVFLTLFLFNSIILLSQQLDKADFYPPLNGRLYLSGSFAELRTNHFHSGLDIKTGGVTGKTVYAVYDGYISRIAVSPTGFGKALYITHPNGYTSVYAHLDRFIPEIDKYIKEFQYSNKKFKVNAYPPKGKFIVKKGQAIAYSGNSGSSGGPHLHFELRKTDGEKPVNPLLFDFPVKDWTRPKIYSVKIFPVTINDYINGNNKEYRQATSGWGENYVLSNNDIIKISGRVFFGINTYDAMNDIPNKNGIYSVECLLDDKSIYKFEADEFYFHETRYINSTLNYASIVSQNSRYYQTYTAPNNKVGMIKNVDGDGTILLHDEKVHTVKFIVKDTYLNTSILTFNIQKDTKVYPFYEPKKYKYFFRYNEDNFFEEPEIKMSVKANSLFDNISFDTDVQPLNDKNALSPVYIIGERAITSFKPFDIAIKIDETLPENIISKLYVGELSVKDKWEYVGGEVKYGWIYFNTNNLGKYRIMVDTIAPTITCVNVKANSINNVSGLNNIKFKIKDDKSGIKKYTPSLNGEWILMDYDPKNNLLVYVFDDKLKSGINQFKLTIEDGCGNIKSVILQLKK